MTRKTAFFAMLFVLFAFPVLADTGAEEVTETLALEQSISETATETVTDAEVTLFETFEETLDEMAANGQEGWCGGWGTIMGCTSNRQCYSPSKCDYTGGACVNNCCYCY